jgi:hypothetical protein
VFEVLEAVKLRVPLFWDMTLRHLVNGSQMNGILDNCN